MHTVNKHKHGDWLFSTRDEILHKSRCHRCKFWRRSVPFFGGTGVEFNTFPLACVVVVRDAESLFFVGLRLRL